MDKHTPLPWHRDGRALFEIKDHGTVKGYVGIADFASEADAAQAHLAVNSHASLLSTIKELMEALEELRRCSNAIVGADMQDENAEEAFTMFWKAQDASRSALSRAKSLMEQKP